jgi:hypothetical protein
MKRALVQRRLEEAESRIQRGQRNVDHQRKTVSDLEQDKQDATIAKALLRMFEKALAVHVADRDQLLNDWTRGTPDQAAGLPKPYAGEIEAWAVGVEVAIT